MPPLLISIAWLNPSNALTSFLTSPAAMKLFDSGLLEKTVYTFVIPVYDLKLGNRINGFQVDSIDTTSYEGFLYVQVSTDKRVIKSV